MRNTRCRVSSGIYIPFRERMNFEVDFLNHGMRCDYHLPKYHHTKKTTDRVNTMNPITSKNRLLHGARAQNVHPLE